MDERLLERVLTAVELIPRGRVAAYGDIGEIVGTGPRHVGNIMRLHGNGVPWWRVTSSYGDLPEPLHPEVRWRWADEGIAWKPNGLGCRIVDYRADLQHLADAFERAWAEVEAHQGVGDDS